MCLLVSRPMKFVTFLRENGYHPKRVVDFPRERDTFRNTIMEIVEDFDEKSYYNNGKPSTCIFSFFIFFFSLFFPLLFFSFFLFSFFFQFCFIFFFAFFFIFLSFSFIFFYFSDIFFHFLSFSFIFFVFVGCSKSDFFWPQFRYDFS